MLLRTFVLSGFLLALPNISTAQMVAMASDAGTFSGRDASTTVSQALMKAGAGDNVKASIYGAGDETIIATASGPISADVDNVDIDKQHSRWSAELLLSANGKNLAPVKLSGRYDTMTQLPMLKRRVQSNEVISADDIEWMAWPATHLRKSTVIDPKDLIGKSPRRIISQDRPIREDEIANPALIAKGMQVTLVYKTPTLEIKTLGEALDSGAKGEVIRVRNIASKSIIEGTIEAGDSVRVTSPDETAEAM
jgi:flagella basal body P-ring formation protein FlgA